MPLTCLWCDKPWRWHTLLGLLACVDHEDELNAVVQETNTANYWRLNQVYSNSWFAELAAIGAMEAP